MVGMTMVAAVEFYQHIAAGKSACHTYGTHGCFGAAVDEAQTLHAGERLADAFSQFGLQQGGNAITAAVAHGLDGCLVDQRIAIAQYEYTPRHAEIDVRIVVDIGEVAAFSLLDKEGG